MQKVEGSSPFIRLKKSRKCGPFVYRIDGTAKRVRFVSTPTREGGDRQRLPREHRHGAPWNELPRQRRIGSVHAASLSSRRTPSWAWPPRLSAVARPRSAPSGATVRLQLVKISLKVCRRRARTASFRCLSPGLPVGQGRPVGCCFEAHLTGLSADFPAGVRLL